MEKLITSTLKNLAVFSEGRSDSELLQQLALRLGIPLREKINSDSKELFFLVWREGALKLIDLQLLKKGGLTVDIEPRYGEQHSFPAPKQGALAMAVGRKTRTIVDATTGWGQDSLAMFRMGYEVSCIERSLLMGELLKDGFKRLEQLPWMQKLERVAPKLTIGNAIDLLADLPEPPDCIYLDPMFPPKRKKSALPKKPMLVLRDLVGDDFDKEELFAVAFAATGNRVVVKSPDYAEPLGVKPSESFQGKLLRYDVYFKN